MAQQLRDPTGTTTATAAAMTTPQAQDLTDTGGPATPATSSQAAA